MNLLTQSIWRDEAFTALLIRHNPLEIIRLTAHDSTPPLYYLILWVWTQAAGSSEVALRLVSTMCWIGTGIVIWRIGEELKLKYAWLVGVLALSQPLLVQYGFEVRAYELMAFFAALSIWLFLVKYRLEEDGRNALWMNLGLVGSLTALLYTHLFGAWVVLILLVWAVFKKLQWWWLVLPIILFVPWVPQILAFSGAGGALPYTLDLRFTEQTLLLLGTPILVLAVPIAIKLCRSARFQMFAVMWALPIVGTFVYSKFKQFLFLDRYLIETVVPMQMLIGMGVKLSWGVGVVLAAIVIQGTVSVVLFNQITFASPAFGVVNNLVNVTKKQPFRELSEYIKSNERTGDVVVNETPLTYFEAKYYGLNPVIYNPGNNKIPTYLGTVMIDMRDNVTQLPSASRYWVISSTEGGGTAPYTFPGTKVSTKTFGRLNLSLYAKD